MDTEEPASGAGWSGNFLGIDAPERAPFGRTSRRTRKAAPGPVAVPKKRGRKAAKVQGSDDAFRNIEDWKPKGRVDGAVDPKDREVASDILLTIGERFAENRAKGKSTAYEEYQRDLSNNSAYLVRGGLMTLKELSEMLMKLEEFRKHTSEQGKTPAALLAEWLRGEIVSA